MIAIHRWWSRLTNERYWLEVTDRPDIGANLKAPKSNETGKDFWSYSIIREVHPGDVIFHYDKNLAAITARSVAVGETWKDRIIWAARGTYARHAGIEPHSREGLYLGLESYSPLKIPVTLDHIRALTNTINPLLDDLEEAVSAPLYYPFERGIKRATRPMQGYLFKLPAFFLELFDNLSDSSTVTALPSETSALLVGLEYRDASENLSIAERDPFAIDPSIVERGLRSHAATQNRLAEWVSAAGMRPRSPAPNEPNFDLAWTDGSQIWVAEVKSLTVHNEEKQLRLGLGQVLRYAQLLTRLHSASVRPVLVAERQPSNDDWMDLCASYNVILLWPPFHEGLIKSRPATRGS